MSCYPKQKLKETIPIVNGIFYHMQYTLPEEFDLDPEELDLLFYSRYSNRLANELLEAIHTDTTSSETMLTQTELEYLSMMIKGVYKEKWDRTLDVTLLNYDAIHNFLDNLSETTVINGESEENGTKQNNLSKTQTNDLTKTQTNNTTDTTTFNTQNQITHGKTETDTDSRTITTTNTGTEATNGTNENGIYGFNSSTASGDTNQTSNETLTLNRTETEGHSGTLTKALSGTDTDKKTGTEALGKSGTITVDDSGTIVTDDTGTVTTTNTEVNSSSRSVIKERYGNIGNIYTQDMVKKEIELRKYLFIEDMLYDVASFISLPIFD